MSVRVAVRALCAAELLAAEQRGVWVWDLGLAGENGVFLSRTLPHSPAQAVLFLRAFLLT